MDFSTGMSYLQNQIQHKKLEYDNENSCRASIRHKLQWNVPESEQVAARPIRNGPGWRHTVLISPAFNTIYGKSRSCTEKPFSQSYSSFLLNLTLWITHTSGEVRYRGKH